MLAGTNIKPCPNPPMTPKVNVNINVVLDNVEAKIPADEITAPIMQTDLGKYQQNEFNSSCWILVTVY